MATREVNGETVVDVKPKTVIFQPYKRANADEELDAEIEALEAERSGKVAETDEADTEADKPAASVEEENWRTRYGDLRRHSQKVENDLKAFIAELQRKAEKAANDSLRPPATEEELGAWMKEYPDVARIIETIAVKKAKELDSTYEQRLTDLASVKDDLNRTKAEKNIAKRHSDFAEIRDDKAWYKWLDSKSRTVQDTIYNGTNNIEDICDVIDMYKQQTGFGSKSAKKPNAANVEEARGKGANAKPNLDTAATWSESRVHALSDAEYDKHEAAITEAIRTNKFVYDLKSAAR
jgi:hypothetical protein